MEKVEIKTGTDFQKNRNYWNSCILVYEFWRDHAGIDKKETFGWVHNNYWITTPTGADTDVSQKVTRKEYALLQNYYHFFRNMIYKAKNDFGTVPVATDKEIDKKLRDVSNITI